MNTQPCPRSPIIAETAVTSLILTVLQRAALEALSTLTPQLVMVDVKMEKVGGFDILRECTEKLPHAAVVMISSFRVD